MMETDILICVLISLEEYGSLQGQILFKNEPNLADLASKSRKRNFGAFYINLKRL